MNTIPAVLEPDGSGGGVLVVGRGRPDELRIPLWPGYGLPAAAAWRSRSRRR
jgi:hypothetical protein